MITLALFRKMAEDGVAGLQKEVNFYWEEMPLQRNGSPASGVWLVTRGGTINHGSPKGKNLRTTVDFYVAFADKTKTEDVEAKILAWLLENRCFCELSGENGTASYDYKNIRLFPTQTPQNAGATENGLIVKTASAEIIYDLTKGE